ncbi:MAG: hypothetical protein P1U83_05175 [Roseovarius sp.]|nr:hypothetical protein [Roseovarius sp.]
MQDWELEVANPLDLDRYLTLFAEVINKDDLRFTLADIIIQAFEETGLDLELDARWRPFLDELVENMGVHAHQIWYWACFDVELEDVWRVAPYMRSICGAYK